MKKYIFSLLLLCVISFFCGIKYNEYVCYMKKLTINKDIQYYGDDGFHLLDIYSKNGIANKKSPVLINIHGGSLYLYDKSLDSEWCEYMAENMDVKVVNINYTLLPYGDIKDCVMDLNSCINWIKNNSEKYYFDDKKIIVCGESAGGYIAGLHAACAQSSDLCESIELKNEIEVVNAYILNCPMTSLDILKEVNDYNEECKRSVADVVNKDDIIKKTDLTRLNYNQTSILLIDTHYDGLYEGQYKLYENLLNNKNFTYKTCDKVENDLCHVFNYRELEWIESIDTNNYIISYIKQKTD